MTEIIIYPDGSCCRDGKFYADGAAELARLGLAIPKPAMYRANDDPEPAIVRHAGVTVKLFPVPRQDERKRRKMSLVLETVKAATRKRDGELRTEFAVLCAQGMEKWKAAAVLGRRYHLNTQYVYRIATGYYEKNFVPNVQ